MELPTVSRLISPDCTLPLAWPPGSGNKWAVHQQSSKHAEKREESSGGGLQAHATRRGSSRRQCSQRQPRGTRLCARGAHLLSTVFTCGRRMGAFWFGTLLITGAARDAGAKASVGPASLQPASRAPQVECAAAPCPSAARRPSSICFWVLCSDLLPFFHWVVFLLIIVVVGSFYFCFSVLETEHRVLYH